MSGIPNQFRRLRELASRQAAAGPPAPGVNPAVTSLGETYPIWVVFLAGICLAGAGAGTGVLADYIRRTEHDMTPVWAFGAFAAVFGLAGVACLASSLHRTGRWLGHQLAALRCPDQPWLADHHWDAAGSTDSHHAAARRRWALVAVTAVVLVPAHVVPFLLLWIPPVAAFALLFVGIWDVAFYAAFRSARRLSAEQARFGNAHLRFDNFPFFLGERCTLKLENDKGLGHYQWLTFTLTCVREKRIVDHGSRHNSYMLTSHTLWSDQFAVAQPGDLPAGAAVPLAFLLPADPQMATHLATEQPVHWELVAAGQTDGVDYHARFLIPVYARPGAGTRP
jgi:hypothetical protein